MSEPIASAQTNDERRRSVERLRQQAANGHAPAARRSNAPAPAAEINWAQVIGQQAAATELRFEREIAALREHVITELAAKPTEVVATGLSNAVVATLAKSVAAVVKPLAARINKLEQRPRREDGGSTEWICSEPNTNDNASCDECGSCGPRMRGGPILLDKVWLAIARPAEYLCITCMQVRCRERLGRELTRSDLRGCDANRSWSVIGGRYHDE